MPVSAETPKLSPEAYKRLEAEHLELTSHGRVNIAAKIEAARALGDLKENGDYHAAKEEQGKMEGRIAQVAHLLKNAEIVEAGDLETVQAGCVVSVVYEGDDEPEKYLLGSIEEKRDGLDIMSPTSPLGEALIGASVDEVVTYESPGGVLKVRVAAIEA